jgi:nucleoid-associated protein YgaU
MPLRKDSRYSDNALSLRTQIDFYGEVDESNIVTSRRFTSWTDEGLTLYTATQGDTFRALSLKFLGSEKYWWAIADVNSEIDLHKGAFGLDANTLISIPPVSFLR